MDPFAPELELLALKAIETEVVARQKMLKALIGQSYADGDKHALRSPVTDGKLGIVYKTDPDVRWEITDRDALVAHLMSFPGNLHVELIVVPEDMPEVLAVLAEHAPGLITETAMLDPDAVSAALAQSKATGEPAAPGISRVKPAGVLTAKPAADAMSEVGRLVQAGVLTWDARPVLPASQEAS